jgi:hypothetical protein
MKVERIELLVERVLVPKIIGDVSFEVHAHQGKTDLLQRLPDRLRGYASWLPAEWRIIVVVDRDDDDCKQLRKRLERIALDARLSTRSAPRGKMWSLANRSAVEELEAWYFGDWSGVRAAYPKVAENVPRRAAFRAPDEIRGGTWESFEHLLQQAGYFVGGLRKIEAARAVAEHMEPSRNTSRSFIALRTVLSEMTA